MGITPRIAITNAHFSGNKGASAMVKSLCEGLEKRYAGNLQVMFLSVYPASDREQNPFPFLQCVTAKPIKVLLACPLAVLHWLFRHIGLKPGIFEKNPIIKAFCSVDLSVDVAGVSYADARGLVMNAYAFALNAIPLLVGTPVMKYSQALGPFHSLPNRVMAKIILPKLKLICSRGAVTTENLRSIGVVKNVVPCADGAYAMADDPEMFDQVTAFVSQSPVFKKPVIGVSVSSVVNKKCKKLSIDYEGIMTAFIRELTSKGFGVMLIANAARADSEKSRNNDLPLCRRIYAALQKDDSVLFIDKEMEPEEIREYISHCRSLVCSRFHAMVGAYAKGVPVLIVGWSHKYQEVSEMLVDTHFVLDYSQLSLQGLVEAFNEFDSANQQLRAQIARNLPGVLASSQQNAQYVSTLLDELCAVPPVPIKAQFADRYLGDYQAIGKGYDANWSQREFCASGGLVTRTLTFLLEQGEIDGAVVATQAVENGALQHRVFIATDAQQIENSGTSIYTPVPVLSCLNDIKAFSGRVAVVATPCVVTALRKMMEKDSALKEKIRFVFGVFCGGVVENRAMPLLLKKAGIPLEGACRLVYRSGLWRGSSRMLYQDGASRTFSYKKFLLTFKNAYFFMPQSCMLCRDHFAKDADASFGDVWLAEEKQKAVKQTAYILRNPELPRIFEGMEQAGAIVCSSLTPAQVVKSNKRPLTFKLGLAPLKGKTYAKDSLAAAPLGKKPSWRLKLAFALIRWNHKFSHKNPKVAASLPWVLVYPYMCMIRLLLN